MVKRGNLVWKDYDESFFAFYGHDLSIKEMLENCEFSEIFKDDIIKSEESFRNTYPNLKVENGYVRCVKAPEDFDYDLMYIFCVGPKRGATPVTSIDLNNGKK